MTNADARVPAAVVEPPRSGPLDRRAGMGRRRTDLSYDYREDEGRSERIGRERRIRKRRHHVSCAVTVLAERPPLLAPHVRETVQTSR